MSKYLTRLDGMLSMLKDLSFVRYRFVLVALNVRYHANQIFYPTAQSNVELHVHRLHLRTHVASHVVHTVTPQRLQFVLVYLRRVPGPVRAGQRAHPILAFVQLSQWEAAARSTTTARRFAGACTESRTPRPAGVLQWPSLSHAGEETAQPR